MRILDVITKCEILIENARNALDSDFLCNAEDNLVKLRELLNEQPELEAGGTHKEGSSSWTR